MGERRDRRVWNRTRGQWVRSVALTFAVAFTAAFALVAVVGTLLGTAARLIGPYIGATLPAFGLGGAGATGAVVGLATAGLWGWIGRPRLLPADTGRTGGNTAGAVVWDGVGSDADGGAADSPTVTP